MENLIFGLSLYIAINYLNYKLYIDFAIAGGVALVFITLLSSSLSNFILQPLAALRQAVLHLSPTGNNPVKAGYKKPTNWPAATDQLNWTVIWNC